MTVNLLQGPVACPRCGAIEETTIECSFGFTLDCLRLRIGDRYPWRPRKQPQNGGRPEGGSVDGVGYMECEHCHKDSFLRVIVREDVILGVEPDPERPGYIPD